MKRNLVLALVTTLLFSLSCKKQSDQPKVNFTPAGTEVKYRITLSQDTITKYSMYSNNQLQSTKYFYFYGATDEIISRNANGIMTAKSVLQIGSNGYAESSLDSLFGDSGTFVSASVSNFEYQNDFLTRHSVDSGEYVYTNSFSEDNAVSANIKSTSWHSGCTNYYSYNSNSNVLDVRDFSNGIFGKPSKNLIMHASWSNGCPCGPSSIPAYSNFYYSFDSNGYVVKMLNYYVGCYRSGTENISGIVDTSVNEYN